MGQTLRYLLVSARPRQWIKNLSLFVGLTFSGWLFLPDKFLQALLAFVIFCMVASAVYLFNDLIDLPKDKLHPVKKNRPIPSGKLPMPIAVFSIALLFFLSLFISYNISFFFFAICLAYFILHFTYSLWLKQVAILDVLAIAAGFMFRVWAGAVAVDAHISVWLLLCVTSFSLFLAVAKRRCELTFLKGVATRHRQALIAYPEKLLDFYTLMFATSSWLTYALFTFSQPTATEMGKYFNFMAYLPSTLIAQKWLMLTVPLVIYGVMRYLQLIYDQGKGESPEEIILTDVPLRTDFLIWVILLIFLIYI